MRTYYIQLMQMFECANKFAYLKNLKAWCPGIAQVISDLQYVPNSDEDILPPWEWRNSSLSHTKDNFIDIEAYQMSGLKTFNGYNWTRFTAEKSRYAGAIVLIYLISIPILQLAISKRARPFDTKRLSLVWNSILTIFSICGLCTTAPVLVSALHNKGFYFTVCAPSIWYGQGLHGIWVAAFVYSKIFELFDTILLILGKRTVSLLQWWHHSTVLLYSWHSFSTRIATGMWFATMNYFVHSIMYFYFAATQYSEKVRKKVRPFAIYITIAQLLQMVIGIAVTLRAVQMQLENKECNVNKTNSILGLGMYVSYFLLFSKLFIDNYIIKSKKKIVTNTLAPPPRLTPSKRAKLIWRANVKLNLLVCLILVIGLAQVSYSIFMLCSGIILSILLVHDSVVKFRLRRIPGLSFPKTLPIFGNLFIIAFVYRFKILKFIDNLRKHFKEDDFFVVWLGFGNHIVVVSSPSAVTHILNTTSANGNFTKGVDYTKKFGRFFGEGLVTSVGESHAKVRSALSPHFQKSAVSYKLGSDHVTKIIEQLEYQFMPLRTQSEKSRIVDIKRLFHLATLQMVGVVLFDGFDFIASGWANYIISLISYGSNLVGMLFLFPPIGFMRARLEACDEASKHVQTNIYDAMIKDAQNSSTDMKENIIHSLIAMLKNENIIEPEMRVKLYGHITTIIAAGQDTTAYLASFFIMLLSQNQYVQDKIRLEVRGVGNNSLDIWTNLPYLKACIQECLRLYSVIPMVTRTVKNGTYAKVGDKKHYVLPPKTRILMPFSLLNRSEEIWGKDAHIFCPERFLEDTTNVRLDNPKKGFLPFGYGKHSCIGFNMAIAEVALLCAHMLQKYRIEPCALSKVHIMAGISLTTRGPMNVRFVAL